jgi:hypothetical protein
MLKVVDGTLDFIDLQDPVNEEEIGLGPANNVTISECSEQECMIPNRLPTHGRLSHYMI